MKLCNIKNILLITHNDLSCQAGDVTLICRRANEMYNKYDIRTNCIIRGNHKLPTHNIDGLSFSLCNDDNIYKYIKDNKPDLIIIYGIMSFQIINNIKSIGFEGKIYLDIQGVPEEMIDFESLHKKILVYPKYFIKKCILKKYINLVDGVFVVTDEMEKYCRKLLKRNKKIKFLKIRCGLTGKIEIHDRKRIREDIRKKLKIENKNVYVFSGYRKPWQKIDDIIDVFKKIDQKDLNAYFCFFCNTDENFEEKIKKCFPKKNYLIKFLNSEEYFDYLISCDVGFMIRDYVTTNKVAFPNKFSDYLNSGLLVCINDAVTEPFLIAKKYDLKLINYRNKDIDIEKTLFLINERNNSLEKYYEKCNKIIDEELIYSNQLSRIGGKEL